jgi:hypothetical protein
MYDKLPISAFVSRPETPTPDLTYPTYNSGTAWIMVLYPVHKQFIGSMDYECYTQRPWCSKRHLSLHFR